MDKREISLWGPAILALLLSSGAAQAELNFNAPPAATVEEQSGCDSTLDVKTAGQICSLYGEAEHLYGKFRIKDPGTNRTSIVSYEPDACRYFFTTLVRARNVINCYKQEALALAHQLNATAAQSAGVALGQTQNLATAGQNYQAMKALHQKYLTQLTKQAADLEKASKAYASMPGFGAALMGGPQASTESRDKIAQYILNTEKNCRGGSISNVPALWWAGVNKQMVRVFQKAQPSITDAVTTAKQMATDGLNAFNGLEKATYSAAGSMNTGVPSGPSTITFDGKDGEGGNIRSVPAEGAVAVGIDRATSILEMAKAGPGAIKLAGVVASIGVEWLRTGAGATTDLGTLIPAGVGCFGLVPAVLATALATVVANDQQRTVSYVQYAAFKLKKNRGAKPEELSQGFCQWLAKRNAAAPAPAGKIGDPGMPGSPGNTD